MSARRLTSRLPLCLLAGALLLAGCGDVPHSDQQELVNFTSAPSGANVSIDNQVLGQTPCELILPKNMDTHAVISKPGFLAADVYVHEVDGDLTPNPVDIKLITELLPAKPGADKAAEMARCLDNLQKYVAAGTLSPGDAAYAEAQIRAFYK